jgi:hypothetical protein
MVLSAMYGKMTLKNDLIASKNRNITWTCMVYFAQFDILCVDMIGLVDGEDGKLLWLSVETCQAN